MQKKQCCIVADAVRKSNKRLSDSFAEIQQTRCQFINFSGNTSNERIVQAKKLTKPNENKQTKVIQEMNDSSEKNNKPAKRFPDIKLW